METIKAMKLFRDLSHSEVIAFRAWARANYKPFGPIDGCWHPVVQEECLQINRESSIDVVILPLAEGNA